jgi:hypothetical protein
MHGASERSRVPHGRNTPESSAHSQCVSFRRPDILFKWNWIIEVTAALRIGFLQAGRCFNDLLPSSIKELLPGEMDRANLPPLLVQTIEPLRASGFRQVHHQKSRSRMLVRSDLFVLP